MSCVFALAASMYLYNAWVALPLSGYDGPFHAGYIAAIRLDGRFPLAHEGWSTFHPPLYYAASALIWWLFPDDADPHAILFSMRLIGVISALGIGAAVYLSIRRLLPASPLSALCGATAILFLPMIVVSASLLGNEVPAAFLCALAMFLVLGRPGGILSRGRSIGVGLVLGLVITTKVSGLLVLAAVSVFLLLQGWRLQIFRKQIWTSALIVIIATFSVSGWFFARNLYHYKKPLVFETEEVIRVMALQGFGPRRSLTSYLSLRPDVLLDPSGRDKEALSAVWPMTFATTWHDMFSVLTDAASPRGAATGRLLFLWGGALTGMLLVGALCVARNRPRLHEPGAGCALLLLLAFTFAGYLAFTYRVATTTALKGSYFSPALLAFGVFVAVGSERIAAIGRAGAVAVNAIVSSFALVTLVVFWGGGFNPRRVNSARFYLEAYKDHPTWHAYYFFVLKRDREP